MTPLQSNPTRSSLLEEGPEACLKFIREYFPLKYDWLQLAEGATTKAASHITLHQKPFDLGLTWIRVAVELYERMADSPVVDGKKTRLRLLLPAISLRVKAITIWGERYDDYLLNPQEVVTRFQSVIDITPVELKTSTSFPRSSNIREALELIKYVEPLLAVNGMKTRFPRITEYCEAANSARANAITGNS